MEYGEGADESSSPDLCRVTGNPAATDIMLVLQIVYDSY